MSLLGICSDSTAGRLSLRVLRRLARALETVLLAFLRPWIPCEESGLPERRAILRVRLQEGAGDPVPDRVGLPAETAALDLHHRVEATGGARRGERSVDRFRRLRAVEVVADRLSVDDDRALARDEPDARDRLLTPAGALEVGRGHGLALLSSIGFCAACRCSGPA